MPKNYRIGFQIDDALAQAAFKRGVKGFDATEKAALRAAKAMEGMFAKAGQSAGAAGTAAQTATEKMTAAAVAGSKRRAKAADEEHQHIDIGLHKLQVTGIGFQDKLTAAAKKSLAAQKAAAIKSMVDSVNARMRAMDVEEKHAAKLERARESGAVGPMGRLALVKRRHLTDEQAQLAGLNKAVDAANSRRVRAAMIAAGEEKDSFGQGIASAFGLSSAATKAGIAILAIGAAGKTLGSVVGATSEAKANLAAMARSSLDTKAALKEIAAMQGKAFPDAASLKQHLGTRLGSGMSHEQAVAHQEEVFNALGTVTKERMSDAERTNLVKEGAKQVSRTSRNEATARAKSAALGMLPNFIKPQDVKKGVTAKETTDMGDAVSVILDRGAATAQVMAEQYREVLTAMTTDEGMTGTFKDPRKAAGLTAIASSFDKGAPGTAVIEASRALRGFTKFRKTKGIEASQAETLKKANITEDMDTEQSMIALFKHVEKEIKPDEAFDVYLARHGFRDQTANMRLAQFYGQYKKGAMTDVMGMTNAPIVPGAADAKDKAFLGSDIGRDAVSKAEIDAAKITEGEKGKELLIAKQAAEARRIKAGADTTTMGVLGGKVVGATAYVASFGQSAVAGRDIINEEAGMNKLRMDAGETGKVSSGFVPSMARHFFGDNEAEAARLRAAIEENTKALQQGKGVLNLPNIMQAPPPLPGPPNGQPRR